MSDYIISTAYDGKPRKMYPKVCLRCGGIFYAPKHVYKKKVYCSPVCRNKRPENVLNCDYCHNDYVKKRKVSSSKHGMNFCSRTCKDLAQRFDSGDGFSDIRPNHYQGIGSGYYRRIAFERYGKRCSRCGYNEYPDVLEVHHKDRDRSNNNVENLSVLCPTCHLVEHYLTKSGIFGKK